MRTYQGITLYDDMLLVELDGGPGPFKKSASGLFVPKQQERILVKARVLGFGSKVDLPDNVTYVYLPDSFTVMSLDENKKFVNKQSILAYEVE